MFRTVFRRAAAAIKETVPDVMAQYSAANNQMTFVSHPGVMAIARITEVGGITRFIPQLTQESVSAIAEFDGDLARKAQIALDNKLEVSWIELEYIEQPGALERIKQENKLMRDARAEIAARPAGDYKSVKVVADGSYKTSLPFQPYAERIDIETEQARAKEQGFVEYWTHLERAKQVAKKN